MVLFHIDLAHLVAGLLGGHMDSRRQLHLLAALTHGLGKLTPGQVRAYLWRLVTTSDVVHPGASYNQMLSIGSVREAVVQLAPDDVSCGTITWEGGPNHCGVIEYEA